MLFKAQCHLRPTLEAGPDSWQGRIKIKAYSPDGKLLGKTERMAMKDGKTPPLGSRLIPLSCKMVLNQFTDRFEDYMILFKVTIKHFARSHTLGTCYLNLADVLTPHPSMQTASKALPFVFDDRYQAVMRVYVVDAQCSQMAPRQSMNGASMTSSIRRIAGNVKGREVGPNGQGGGRMADYSQL
jgi:hypothetical protein